MTSVNQGNTVKGAAIDIQRMKMTELRMQKHVATHKDESAIIKLKRQAAKRRKLEKYLKKEEASAAKKVIKK